MHEWQQCESCTAALYGAAKVRLGLFTSPSLQALCYAAALLMSASNQKSLYHTDHDVGLSGHGQMVPPQIRSLANRSQHKFSCGLRSFDAKQRAISSCESAILSKPSATSLTVPVVDEAGPLGQIGFPRGQRRGARRKMRRVPWKSPQALSQSLPRSHLDR